ncbi:MAG: hypothetical protein ACJAQT_000114 [Akkermansiaceae bacterium]|jgi:hypothetical protein
MNTKFGLITAAWALSCGTAFLIGRTSSDTAEKADQAASLSKSPVSSSRGASRGGAAEVDSGKRTRRTTSRSSGRTTAPSEAQLETLQAKVRELKDMSDPIARAEGFLELVRNLGPDEYLSALAAFREGGINNEQFGEYRLLLTAWAKVNPLEALDYAKENTGTPFARQTILTAWAKNDSEGAVTWARENFDNEGDENRANPWMIGVIEGIASSDLGRATQLLEELPFSRGRGEALEAVFTEVSAGGNEDAKLWVAQLTDPKLKEGAAARLAGELAQENPQGAAEWASSLGPDVMKRSAGTIVSNWAEADLNAARTWVAGQSQDIIAASGPSLVEKMIQKEDIATASAWLADFEGMPEFDDSVRTFVRNSAQEQPEVAADWIMKLTNERDQTGTFHRILRGWEQKDKAGAMDYIRNNPVPESIAKRAGIIE